MTFIDTIPEDEATGAVAAMYETDREVFGYLPNFTKGFSARPDVYAAWRQLNGAVKANMDLRRYEIATLAAASRLRSGYCCLAHGKVALDKGFLDAEGLKAIVNEGAARDEIDQAVVDLAAKVATDATSVGQEDVDRLRSLGLTDAEIADVVLAASVRSFFSKTLDGLGIEPDAQLSER
jgi:alkylhydroperoxidase family enzyme